MKITQIIVLTAIVVIISGCAIDNVEPSPQPPTVPDPAAKEIKNEIAKLNKEIVKLREEQKKVYEEKSSQRSQNAEKMKNEITKLRKEIVELREEKKKACEEKSSQRSQNAEKIEKHESSNVDVVPIKPVNDALFQFTKFAVQIPDGSPEGLASWRNELTKMLTEWGVIIEPNALNSEFTFTLKGEALKESVNLGHFKSYQAKVTLTVVRVSDGSIIAGPKTFIGKGPVNLQGKRAQEGAFENALVAVKKYIIKEIIKKNSYIVRREILVSGIPQGANLLWIKNGLMTKTGVKHTRITEFNTKSGRATIEIACSSRVAENILYYIKTLPGYTAKLKLSTVNACQIKAEFTK